MRTPGRSTTSRLTRTVGFWENCPPTRLKAISLKQWAKLSPGLPCTGTVAIRTITVRVYDDQPFDRQIVIPAVAFSGAKHERENNDIYSSCRLIVRKNGAEIYNRTALDNTLIYSGVIDMPAGHGHMTLEFSVSAWLVNNWYPTASISDLLVVVMKKATAGITIS